MKPTPIELIATCLFGAAVIHTFSVVHIQKLAHRYPKHAGLFHLLAEVEVVFALWAFALIALMFFMLGKSETLLYLNSRNYTEPLFVFAIMLIAASNPIVRLAQNSLQRVACAFGKRASVVMYFLSLSLMPLLGSLMTEPAAMTIAALTLGALFFAFVQTDAGRYVTLGTLFVNVSIGGVLTAYAAPPVLMVAGTWGWDSLFMLTHFGWKAALAVVINAGIASFLLRKELVELPQLASLVAGESARNFSTLIHSLLLALVVICAHEPVLFMGLLLVFVAYAHCYPQHQKPLIWREALMVACFLAGLVILGGLQRWWLEPALTAMNPAQVYYGAIALTAITDNAALTYLASQVPNLSDAFKYFVVAGAVVGGGLTVIANAPNPAGAAILAKYFPDNEISPLKLFLGALLPTLVAGLCLKFL
jgi:Putative Na+/H+ antiporter